MVKGKRKKVGLGGYDEKGKREISEVQWKKRVPRAILEPTQ